MVVAEKMPIHLADPENLKKALLSAFECNVPRELRSKRLLVASCGLAFPDRIEGNLLGRISGARLSLPDLRTEKERRMLAEFAPFTDLAAFSPQSPNFCGTATRFVEDVTRALLLLIRRRFLERKSEGPGRPVTRAIQHFVLHEFAPPGLPPPKTHVFFDLLVVRALVHVVRLRRTPLLLLVHERLGPFVQIFASIYAEDGRLSPLKSETIERIWEATTEESLFLARQR